MNIQSLAMSLLLGLSPGILLAQQSLDITIENPASQARVKPRDTISGKVSDPNATVWVVIHPKLTSDFWVQPPVTVDNDGTWEVEGHFGREGAVDSGKPYEIRAFANPAGELVEGLRTDWPSGAAKSRVIKATRE